MTEQFINFSAEDFDLSIETEETLPDDGIVSFSPDDFDISSLSATPDEKKEEEEKPDVAANLPETLRVDPLAILEPFGIDVMEPLDTGIPLKGDIAFGITGEDIAASLVGWGAGMMDSTRGIKQLLDIDVDVEKANQAALNDLYADENLGTAAVVGNVGGLITEPLSFLIPGVKIRSAKKALVYGATTGTVFGFTGFVDEEQGETRLGNTVTGAVLGGSFVYGLNKLGKAADGRRINKASRTIREFEEEYANLIVDGHSVPEANAIIKENYPHLIDRVKDASDLLQVKPDLPSTEKAAKEVLKYSSGLYKAGSSSQIDKAAGMIHTRVKNLNEVVAKNLRRMEFNIHRRPHEYKQRTKPFEDMYKALGRDSQRLVNKAILNGDFDIASKEISRVRGQEGADAFNEARQIFVELGDELRGSGVISEQIDNYWHRGIKNVKGLLRATGSTKEEAKTLASQLAERNKQVRNKRGYDMTPHEEAIFIQGKLNNDKQLELIGYAKSRQINKVPDHLLDFYATPIESLDSYLHNAIWDIEQARFLGPKNLRISKDNLFDPEWSINAWAKNMKELKGMDNNEIRELKGMLKARLGAGQQSMSPWLKAMKVFSYSALLGNPVAAGTQFGDIGSSAYKNGVRRSVKAVAKTLTGQTDIKVKDLGLVDTLIQEFADASRGDKALNFFLKYSGFQGVDRLGKSTLINGSLDKFSKGALTPDSSEFAELGDKYRKAWGKEFQDLVRDLKVYGQSKKPEDITDNIRFLVWNELSDIQPISLSEVPENYLKMPNGKIVYMLKTFLMKQFDIIRVDGYQKIREGKVAEGSKNIAKYLMLMGGANLGADVLKDMALGKEIDMDGIEDVPGEWAASIMRTYGIGEYFRQQAAKEGVLRATAEQILIPPVNIFDDIFYKSWAGEEFKPEKITRYIPIGGRLITERMKEE